MGSLGGRRVVGVLRTQTFQEQQELYSFLNHAAARLVKKIDDEEDTQCCFSSLSLCLGKPRYVIELVTRPAW